MQLTDEVAVEAPAGLKLAEADFLHDPAVRFGGRAALGLELDGVAGDLENAGAEGDIVAAVVAGAA